VTVCLAVAQPVNEECKAKTVGVDKRLAEHSSQAQPQQRKSNTRYT